MLFLCYKFLLGFLHACSSIASSNWHGKEHIGTFVHDFTCQNKTDLDNATMDQLFIFAAKNGDVEFIKQAIQQGMPLNELQNIIHKEGCFCGKNLVRYLYTCTNTRYNKTDQYGNTILHTASNSGNIFAFCNLLKHYQDVPLHQYKNIIANLEIKNKNGEILFHILASRRDTFFAKVILDQLNKLASSVKDVNLNQDINKILTIKNNNEDTPLNIAYIRKDTEMMRLLYPKNYYTCNACPKSYNFPNDLITHEREHTGPIPHECNYCGKRLMTPSQLEVHMITHTEERPFKCDTCRKSFKHKNTLIVHKRTHTGENPYKCEMCGQGFIKGSYLTIHRRKHTGEKPYKCGTCGRMFSHSGNLTVHIRTHTEEKPYKCNECGKNFKYSSSLITHMTTHTGKKPHKCNQCNKAFTKKDHLKQHISTHTRKKRHQRCVHSRKMPL